MANTMRLKVLMVPTSNAGITYWRFFNFAKAAHRLGAFDCKILWWDPKLKENHSWQFEVSNPMYMARITSEMNAYARDSDIIIFQGTTSPMGLSTIYAIKDAYPDKPVLSDIDDDFINTPTYNVASQTFHPGSDLNEIRKNQIKHTDGVITTTPALQELLLDLNPNVYIAQNSIDLEHWGKTNAKRKKGVRIGWAGGASHNEDLKIIEPVVHSILAKYKEATFVFVHGIPPFLRDIPRVEEVYKFADIDKYPQHLASRGLDIGIAPLEPNLFNLSKSNLRWLEYSALRIPSVCSKWGHFAQTIRHGEDGFLADDAEEFEKHIETLIKDRTLRVEMGKKAYQRIVDDFDVNKTVYRYRDILQEAIRKGPVASPPPLALGIEDERPLEPLEASA